MKLITILIACLVLVGCERNLEVASKESVGTIISAKGMGIVYMGKMWTEVHAEKAIISICVQEPILLGKEAFIVNYKNGRRGFSWEGSKHIYYIGK